MEPEKITPGDASAGFEVLSNREMPEYSSRALRYRHLNTGCEVFHLWNDDPENLFAFTFRTPPQDDTGAAHILEHSVLCGSRRFPLKDPFVVLLKSSLQTFLNAFTFPDKTVYPASSMVEKDFFNLMLVTGDAVFFPLLQKEVFMQEAHRLQPSSGDEHPNGLKRSGVVFNEMKGVFSSAESVVADASLRALFPDSPYGFESGGDPKVIATLTHQQLQDFHRKFYHPANCRIFLYGNIPTPKILAFLDENFLRFFDPAEIRSGIALQPRWQEPRRVERTFPAETGKSTVTLNWLTIPVTDPLKLLAFEVLSELLVGNEGAPLHKALLESELGDDLSPATGLETELNEIVFTVGLRGTEPQAAEAMEKLVISTLKDLVSRGVPEQIVQAALHRVEFRNSEIQRGGRPYSLTLMRKTLRGWMHGSDPEVTLEFRRSMDALRAEVARGGYFEKLIEGYLVSNPHRTTVVVRPDPAQQQREQEEERRELQQIQQHWGSDGRQRLEEELERLKAFQEQQDSPEVLARIPALHLGDLRREVETIPSEHLDSQLPVLYHDLYTNGVVYLDLAFDTRGLDTSLLHLVPLFSRAVRGSGLPGIPYYDVASKLSLYTGGFGASLSADNAAEPAGTVQQRLIFRVKMLEHNLETALGLVRDLLLTADFRDLNRLQTIILEMRNDLKASLVPGGSHYAGLRACARLSDAAAIEERWKGISQYIWLDGVSRGLPENLADVASALEEIRLRLISPSLLSVNLTCAQKATDKAVSAASDLVAALASERVAAAEQRSRTDLFPLDPLLPASMETLVGSMNVSFVAHAFPASPFGSRENAFETVLAHYLRTGFLWERIRMQGGAYGAGAVAHGLDALFAFSSYRDPNTLVTLDAFREALGFATRSDLDPEPFEKIVLGAAGNEEKPMAPGEKGFVALKREILGISDAQRQARRDTLIDCKPKQLRAAASRLLARFNNGVTAIVTHAEAVQREKSRLEALKAATLKLPD
ncbi:MAG: insulinase family protein [Spirochaetaceae bacterium]|nr:MAG: insulinase family protein [Spirochaetaceae bacterium]